jgi:hypothetical protein
MISTWRRLKPAISLRRSIVDGLRAPSRSTTIRSVPVRRASTWSISPIRSTMSSAGANRSTAWPPVLRSAGARSTTVTRKPLRRSQ